MTPLYQHAMTKECQQIAAKVSLQPLCVLRGQTRGVNGSVCHVPYSWCACSSQHGGCSPHALPAAPPYPALGDQEQIHKADGVSSIPTSEEREDVRDTGEGNGLSSLSSNSAQWDCHYLRSGAIKLLTTFGLWAPAPTCAFGSHPRICWLVITHQGPRSLS